MAINKYSDTCLIGSECLIDDSFIPDFTRLCGYVKALNLKLYITSSFRTSIVVPGAIVTPAVMSNHLIGNAIDCNIVDNGVFWNSVILSGTLTGNVLALIELVRKDVVLRWGGDFNTRDVVHFDNGLNIHNPVKYKQLLSELQTISC